MVLSFFIQVKSVKVFFNNSQIPFFLFQNQIKSKSELKLNLRNAYKSYNLLYTIVICTYTTSLICQYPCLWQWFNRKRIYDTIKENESLVENLISIFLHHFLKSSKCFVWAQTPIQLDNWLQSYERFDNAKNNMKQRNLITVLPISQKQHLRHPTHSS